MKSLFSILAFFTFILGASSQGAITLLTFESFTFADKFDTEYGYGKIGDAFQWGAGLEFEVRPGTAVELIYQRMDAEARYDGYLGTDYSGNIGINYILLGFTGYQPFNDVVSGFGTFDMGAGFTSNLEESLASENVTKFALGGRLGVRIAPVNSKLSIRLHAQLLSPVQWFGGGFYFGTGGAGAGVSTGSTIWQFNLGGSVNYQIK
jgi:hypothetical protein